MKRFLHKKLLMMIEMVLVISLLVFVGYNKLSFGVISRNTKLLTEYQRWEDRLAMENPDYDDLIIYVDINAKTLYLLDNNKDVIKKYPIATGTPETPTPIGAFKIVNKAKLSGVLGSRWMGLNVPWGSYGIHGTDSPSTIGYNASQGCVRLRNRDVEELYNIVKVGTVAIIDGGPYGPFGNGFRILKPGDRGSDVAEVQNRLTSLGYYIGPINGIYEDGVRWALRLFLRDRGIEDTDQITYEIYRALGIQLMD